MATKLYRCNRGTSEDWGRRKLFTDGTDESCHSPAEQSVVTEGWQKIGQGTKSM